jgi:hypothetical protein
MTLPTLFIAHPFCRPLGEITHDVALRGATKRVGSESCHVQAVKITVALWCNKKGGQRVMPCAGRQNHGSCVMQQKGWQHGQYCSLGSLIVTVLSHSKLNNSQSMYLVCKSLRFAECMLRATARHM